MSTTVEHEVSDKVRLDEKSGRLHLYHKNRPPKVKRLVTFKPQLSSFDRFNPNTSTDLFRGFYTLFWIFLGIMVLRVVNRSWQQEHTIVGLSFARLIGGDGFVLALSDLALVSSTILCVPYMQVFMASTTPPCAGLTAMQQLIEKGYIRYWWTGVILQHIGQVLLLATVITWVGPLIFARLKDSQWLIHFDRPSSGSGTGSKAASLPYTPSACL